MTTTRKISSYCFFILLALLPQCLTCYAQSENLDHEKSAVELSKKDISSYDSLPSLIIKLQKNDSLQAFQFLDKLAKKGRSKRDHFQAFFNCLKARIIYYKCYYEFYMNRPTSVNKVRCSMPFLSSS